MDKQKVIEILTAYNKWRRGETDETPFTIKELGIAIDMAVELLKTK